MYIWAHGKQEVRLDLSQSDLPRVFFEGDCPVEDELQWKKKIKVTLHTQNVF